MKSPKHGPAAVKAGMSALTTNASADRPIPDFLIWQLADSAFPTGGFAHSNGLEAAWQHGEVRGRVELAAFVEASLDQTGHASLPFVLTAYDTPEELGKCDALCEAFTTNHVANRASRLQGRAYLTAAERIFKAEMAAHPWSPPFAHFPPVFGAVLRRLNVPRETVSRMFFFYQVRSVLTAAVRLNIVGPMEAQVLQQSLSPRIEQVLNACASLTLDQVAQTAPLLDLWQGAQDRLYSRLFQS